MMKRLCLLLALALVAACLPAMAAEDVLLTNDNGLSEYSRVFSDGETLYLVGYQGISAWQPGDDGAKYYAYEMPDHDNTYLTAPFICEGQLYAFRLHPLAEDGETKLEKAALCRMSLEGGEATFEEVGELDWRELLTETDDGVQINLPFQIAEANGAVYILYYDGDNFGARASHLAKLDMEEMSIELLDSMENVWQMVPYTNDNLLMLTREGSESEAALRVYDTEDDDDTRFARFEVSESAILSGLAYDPDEDRVCLCLDGDVYIVEEGDDELEKPVGHVAIQQYDPICAACVLKNGSFVYCNRSAAVTSLSEQEGEEGSLVISDSRNSGTLNTVLERFQAAHGGVKVRVNRSQDKIDNLVENLINQDDSVDIYLLPTSLPVYEGLRRRGFMVNLEDSAAVAELTGRMYPVVREALTIDGHIVAMPVDVSISAVGFNAAAFETLGISAGDLPDNWSDLLDFLPTLVQPLEDSDGVRASYDFETIESIRTRLFNQLFADYQSYMSQTDEDMGYNTPLLRDLLAKLDRVDFEALGFPEEEDEDAEFEDVKILMDAAMECAFNGDTSNTCSPVLLGMEADKPGRMVMKLTVAFINPYSRHMDAARAFMETLAGSLPNRVCYSLIPDLNTPVRGPADEAELREFEETLENLYAQLEKAEGSRRTLIQEKIDIAEEDMAEAEANAWEISQKAIDWYRAGADRLNVAPSDWLDSESRQLMTQYCKGEVSADEMLQRIDQKVRMMRMEGN